ncbi:MAG: hypothetical protein A3J14_01940 [Candidatus Levybacteria bacterium RIFCSPLOWO2_02_FULL_37_18]|nr:MAG: hypothetical protein A3J14_01940 [Candidatus Levybacteria bacterium RIFCSPLOWO2_02_FULL_37_18]
MTMFFDGSFWLYFFYFLIVIVIAFSPRGDIFKKTATSFTSPICFRKYSWNGIMGMARIYFWLFKRSFLNLFLFNILCCFMDFI